MEDTNAQLEDLLASLAVLTDHNEQMLEKQEQQGVASAEQQAKQAALISDFLEQVTRLQNKEKLLTDETITSIRESINQAFARNAADYHSQINKVFTKHINIASDELKEQVQAIEHQSEELSNRAKVAKNDFEDYVKALIFNEDLYRNESFKLKQEVGKTLQEVSEGTRERLDALSAEYASKLSTKTALVLSSACFSVLLFSFFAAWLFIPSKSDIADRRGKYMAMGNAQLFDNLQQNKDGVYARIDRSTCYDAKGKFAMTVTYCKFD